MQAILMLKVGIFLGIYCTTKYSSDTFVLPHLCFTVFVRVNIQKTVCYIFETSLTFS